MKTELNLQFITEISLNLSIPAGQVNKTLELLFSENCTIPFISRYRKEATGGLDEVQVNNIKEGYEEILEREKRRTFILETIQEMGKLTPDLKKKIQDARKLNQLEDIYAPYKSKRKTKGQKAQEAGLLPLSLYLRETKDSADEVTKKSKSFINKEAGYDSSDKAIEGAGHILIEEIYNNTELKNDLRLDYWKNAMISATKRKDADKVEDCQKYQDYFEFSQNIKELKDKKYAHRFLALRRGMLQEVLRVNVEVEKDKIIEQIYNRFFLENSSSQEDFLRLCAKKAFSLHLHTALELEIKSELKKESDVSAIDIFGVNLKSLLLQPYLGQKAVMGVDPGIRTGCKIACIDKNGEYKEESVIYPHAPRNDIAGSAQTLKTLIEKYRIEHIAVGNGTFGRETLQIVNETIKHFKLKDVSAMLVNEDGASIYSASDIAREEFPDQDLTVRGAISIARRFQDPLAELVKIDPKSIGVGQYQHDVNQVKLKKSLGTVVENCVNFVGVDLNTASFSLLSFVSGIGPALAKNIVKKRSQIGGFKMRDELLDVTKFSKKIFEQSAGFLRIYAGDNPLDKTSIHPERYQILLNWCAKHNLEITDLLENEENIKRIENSHELKQEIGEFTHIDICKALRSPGQDPRTKFESFSYREDLTDIKSVKIGEWYPGLVTNITQFGAFIDLGIKENGLVHISQMADQFVSNPLDVLKVGQEVKAKVIEIDMSRKRIALSLKKDAQINREKSSSRTKTSSSTSKNRETSIHRPQEQERGKNPFAGLKGLNLKGR